MSVRVFIAFSVPIAYLSNSIINSLELLINIFFVILSPAELVQNAKTLPVLKFFPEKSAG